MNPGQHIGKYRLTRRLGQGAMGVVWGAVNEDTQKEVALKLVADVGGNVRQRLLREAVACGRLDHRNVVTIYDVGSTPEGEPFLVMQLCSGETLREKLKREGPLAPGVAARIGAAIASGLAAAHGVGVVHRDLKPENVFLHREAGGPVPMGGDPPYPPAQPEPVVKLLDFGMSRLEAGGGGKLTATGTLLGSPAYMSPEQAACEVEIGPLSDLWSLGVVLFEMLAGRRPFQSPSLPDLLVKVVSEPVPLLSTFAPDVPADLAALVDGCLQRDMERRPATAALVAERLLAASSAQPAAPPTPKQPPSFPVPGAAAPASPVPRGPAAAGTAQVFRVPADLAAMPATSSPSKAAPPAAAPAKRGSEAVTVATARKPPAQPVASSPSRAPWIVAGGLAVLSLVLAGALFGRRGDDAAPAPSGREAARGRQAGDKDPARVRAPAEQALPAESPPAPNRRGHPAGAQKPLDSAPDQTVSLIIDVEVPSQVFLDDQLVGATPMDKLEVRPGTHQLRFKHATLGERSMTLDAKLGVQMLIKVDFEEKDPSGDSAPR